MARSRVATLHHHCNLFQQNYCRLLVLEFNIRSSKPVVVSLLQGHEAEFIESQSSNTAMVQSQFDSVTSATGTSSLSQSRETTSSSAHPLVTFGTYNYKHPEILEDSVGQAVYLMNHYKQIPHIDTAMKYNNLSTILKVLERDPHARIGWKVEHSSRAVSNNMEVKSIDKEPGKSFKGKGIQEGIAFLKSNAPNARIFRILMHNYCGKKAYLEFQRLVEQEYGVDMPIGICNVSAEQLEDLVNAGTSDAETVVADEITSQKARVDWVQNEYHPFLESRVPEVCRQHDISFEAHSVMTNLAQYPELFKMVGLSNVVSDTKCAELALNYAAKQGGVCFATTDFAHLKQNLGTLLKPKTEAQGDDLLSAMTQFSSFRRIVRYRGAETSRNVNWVKTSDPVQIRNEILPKLWQDIALYEAGRIPSNLCVQIPKSFRAGGDVHALLAEMLYGQNLERQMNELREKLLKKMGNDKRSSESKDNEDISNPEISISDEDLKIRLEARWSCQLNVLLKKMRHRITLAKAFKKAESKRSPKPVKAVEQPDALPMGGYPEAEEFTEFIQFLRTGGELPAFGGKSDSSGQRTVENLSSNIRFKYGTINSDGRLDMCKQGLRNAFTQSCDAVIQDGQRALPVNVRFKYGTINSDGRLDMCKQGFRNVFQESCDAVIQDKLNQSGANKKPLIEHYLIGNNRIAEDGDTPGEGKRRVAALACMIRHRPDIVTWFLAGNCLDSEHIQCVAEALEQTRSKYVWLKMNPVKTGAYHLGKMLIANHHIELMDLFNCGLCDDGVAAFTRGLVDGAASNHGAPHSNLRHLYLSINAITSTSSLHQMLSFMPQLESLFLGVNPMGDKGLKEIADVIIHKVHCRHALQRLNLGSMGLTDVSLPVIESIVKACPKLVSLELDSYKSTEFFSQRHNRFDVGKAETRAQVEQIARALVDNAALVDGPDENSDPPLMQYLGLHHSLVVGASLSERSAKVSEAKATIDDFVENQLHKKTGVNVNGIINFFPYPGGKSYLHIGENREYNLVVPDVESDEAGVGNMKGIKEFTARPRVSGGGIFLRPGVTQDNLRAGVRHPWPAVDHIKSIYRNTMKV